jgi:hypothetical protein
MWVHLGHLDRKSHKLTIAAWNWGAKSGLFYAGTNFLCLVWCFFRLPETKGRSFGEIDLLFENKVSARMFKYTKVDREYPLPLPCLAVEILTLSLQNSRTLQPTWSSFRISKPAMYMRKKYDTGSYKQVVLLVCQSIANGCRCRCGTNNDTVGVHAPGQAGL